MGRILSPSNGASKLSAPPIPNRQLSVSIKNYSRNPEYINNYTLLLTTAMHCRHLSMSTWVGGWHLLLVPVLTQTMVLVSDFY